MKIVPEPDIIYIKTEEVKAGLLDTSSKASAIEYAEVIAVGNNVKTLTNIQAGDKIFVKSWSIDNINYNGEWYRFVNITSGGILAIVQ